MRYLPHLIYSVALTTISLRLLSQRKETEAQKAQLTAQISILESIVHQLRTNKPLSDDELTRLRKLARAHDGHPEPVEGNSKDKVNWKDVIFGRNRTEEEMGKESDWDTKDMETGNTTAGSRLCLGTDLSVV
jgi:hypothetical protein